MNPRDTPPRSVWEIAGKVFETYPGGETEFWRDWGRGRLADQTLEWFRRHAEDLGLDDEVRAADERLERRRVLNDPDPAVQRRKRAILEALAFAVETPGPVTREARDPLRRDELRRRFVEALFDLLEHDLEIDLAAWSGLSEAAVGTILVRAVFPELAPARDHPPPTTTPKPTTTTTTTPTPGDGNDEPTNKIYEISVNLLPRFQRDSPLDLEIAADLPNPEPTPKPGRDQPPPGFLEIAAELDELRERVADGRPLEPIDEALKTIAWPLLVRNPDGAAHRLEPGFRNYLRARLREVCRQFDLRPRLPENGGRFTDLDAAFDALDRRRIAERFRKVQYPELDRWLVADLAT